MNKASVSKCPSTDELVACLDSVVQVSTQLTTHIERCHLCRETLSFLAGQPQWWSDAESLLALTPSPSEFRLSQRVCALSDLQSCDGERQLSEHELQQLRHLLAEPSHPELLGRISRYELEQLVGRGGMGLVFRAHDTELHRVVAVKTLAMHLIPIASARERFIREARAVASLSHPHIVPMYDVITDGPVPALVMQFIAGTTLQQRITQRGSLPVEDVLQISLQLADALVSAHGHGLVHRDIKPGNVLLEADGSRALLSDFGLVRALDSASLTHSGLLAGTPDYMSPEQARGDSVDARSDLFSLGSVLYTMLTGHPPFRAPEPMAVLNRICHERHRAAHLAESRVPIELSQLIDRLLAKNPKHRFKDATEVRDQLLKLSQSPRRLVAQRGSRRFSTRTILSVLAVACMLLTLNLFKWWNAPEFVRYPNRALNSYSSFDASTTEAVPFDANNLESSISEFTELRAIDSLLRELNEKSELAINSKLESELNGSIEAPTVIDFQLGQISAELNELEATLSK